MVLEVWQEWVAGVAGFIGLLIGSFLNVVIYRLPKIMEREWARECAETTGATQQPSEKFNLMTPRSRCSSCGHLIRWYENIPLLSYVFLRGKCSACGAPYGLRYPLVEAVTGGLFFFCAWHWGWTMTALVDFLPRCWRWQ
jgi:leader peptidase (prepilin peptidase) / N-methyltransferase